MRILLILAAFAPLTLFAAEAAKYTPLVGLPGVDPAEQTFDSFINALYALSIAIAALLAVIKIIIAGVKWMLTDVVTSKEEAKKDIKGALIGLLLVLAAVIILTLINPDLVNVNFNPERIEQVEYVPVEEVGYLPDMLPGDKIFNIPDYLVGMTGMDKELICTFVVPDRCPIDGSGQLTGSIDYSKYEAFCYAGEWRADEGVCLVRKAAVTDFESGNTLEGVSGEAIDWNSYNTGGEVGGSLPPNPGAKAYYAKDAECKALGYSGATIPAPVYNFETGVYEPQPMKCI